MYKIKFLVRIDTGPKGDLVRPQYHTTKYSESELPIIASKWRSLGFSKIVEIEAGKKSKFSIEKIINMFYGTDNDAHDLKIKTDLLKKYGYLKEEIPSVNRNELIKKLKDAGVEFPSRNPATEWLIEEAAKLDEDSDQDDKQDTESKTEESNK